MWCQSTLAQKAKGKDDLRMEWNRAATKSVALNEGACRVVCQARVCDSLILTLGHCFSDSRFHKSQTSFVIVNMLKPVLTIPNGDRNDN